MSDVRITHGSGVSKAQEATPSGYVGFANLPKQVHRKSVKKGFEFTLMVVGESGLGKSTLINSLFLTDVYGDDKTKKKIADSKDSKTLKLESHTVDIEEKGVKLRLTVVDTPGFGDGLDSSNSHREIIRYIDQQFAKYLRDESGLNRKHIVDSRVHCCFYFISPYGHGLKPLDIEVMKELSSKVILVPVIAKADCLSQSELMRLKKRVLKEISINDISIYSLTECESDEDEEYKAQVSDLRSSIPFAVVGANTTIEVKGRKVRGRQYPWGVVEVENPKHCDFAKIRTMLITHMQDMQEVTHDLHYENYRSRRLASTSSLLSVPLSGIATGGTGTGRFSNLTHDELMSENGDSISRTSCISSQGGGGGLTASSILMLNESSESSNSAAAHLLLSEKERQLQAKEMELKRMQAMIQQMQMQMSNSTTNFNHTTISS